MKIRDTALFVIWRNL